MAVKYTLNEIANPQKPEEPKKWYARAQSNGELTFRQLAKEVAEISSTVSDNILTNLKFEKK